MALDLNKNDSEVIYFHEIVRELSEEHGVDYNEMKEICSSSIDYVKHLTKQKETLAILLPFLGVLYFSKSIGSYFRTRYKKIESLKEQVDILDYRIEEAKKPENKTLRKRPFLYQFKKILLKKGYTLPRGGVTNKQKEFWSVVSEMQNDIING